jgi:signal transduction histidine kinase/ActR/RegA family two-component response regulator
VEKGSWVRAGLAAVGAAGVICLVAPGLHGLGVILLAGTLGAQWRSSHRREQAQRAALEASRQAVEARAAHLEARSAELQQLAEEGLEQQARAAQQQLALEETNHQLASLSEAKSQFLAAISHELRTPLNAILGFEELLMEGVGGTVTDAQAEYLEDIRSSGAHLLRLINDILDYSKLEAGKLQLAIELVAWGPPVQEAVGMLQAAAQKKGVTLTCALEPGVHVKADPLRLKQVALNLVANAVKFTPRGGQVEVNLQARDARAELSVKDSGIGIAPEHHAAIFEAFRQVEGDSTRRYEGTGLGLALVKKLLEPMSGTVRVESEAGQGATFVVELPRESSRVLVPAASRPRHAEIVVAEDDDATRHMVVRVLQANGCEVRGAANGQRALEALAEHLPDVLVLDLMMPELDGFEVLRRLRALPGGGQVQVLVFSASEPVKDAREALVGLGAQILVKGTVGTTELVSAVLQLAPRGQATRSAA